MKKKRDSSKKSIKERKKKKPIKYLEFPKVEDK